MNSVLTVSARNSFPHCIPAEDLLPQRKHIDSWDEGQSLLNSKKVGSYFPGVVHILFWS
jgi:hypothetical protein